MTGTKSLFNWLLGPLKIALTLGALGTVFYTVDLSAAWKLARGQNFWLVLAAAAFMILQTGCGAVRWHLILRRLGATIAAFNSVRIFYISVFFSICMWASIGGDLVRGWLAVRNNVSVGTSALSVILDRVAALASVAVIVLLTIPLFVERVGGNHPATALIPAVLAATGLVGIVIVGQLDRIPSTGWWGARVLRQLRRLGEATRIIFLRPASILPIMTLAVIAQIFGSLVAYAIAKSLGIGATVTDCIVLMQPITLLAALPISIGGWGVREAAVITLFGFVGVSPSAALVLSVQMGILGIIISLPGGLLFLAQKLRSSNPREAEVGAAAPATSLE